MNKGEFSSKSAQQLVEAFEAVAIQQDWSLINADLKKFNREYKQLQAIKEELRSRPGDQREALALLLNHPKAWVRFCAANGTYSLNPQRSRMHMQYLKDHALQPYKGEAGMALFGWARGQTPS